LSLGEVLTSQNRDDFALGIARTEREKKAVKADDAEVPRYLWEEHYYETSTRQWADKDRPRVERAFDGFRLFALRWWKRKVTSSFGSWMKEKHKDDEPVSTKAEDKQHCENDWDGKGQANYARWWQTRYQKSKLDIVAARDAVGRAAGSSWWAWDAGSRPFHWRWPVYYQQRIRDGIPVHFTSEKPEFRRKQQPIKDAKTRERVKEKLNKVRDKGYICPGFVKSLTSFFPVDKGLHDIRMVYDGSASGLNKAMWVPRFPLPTIQTHLRAVEEGTYMADLDIAEMFLNFMLHDELRELSGVDLTELQSASEETMPKIWERWQRAAMGLKSSPYQCVQGIMVAEELIKGDESDPENVFFWDWVRMNLPGSDDYDPSLPWVSKVRKKKGKIAADIFIFVDDVRATGATRAETWRAVGQVARTLSFLGLQDAPRKRRDSALAPGAWTGSVLRTDLDGVHALTSDEKWNKTKDQLAEVKEMLAKDATKLSRKRLEQIRGFLLYVTRTYTGLAPYMIGFHLTIDGWRRNRNEDGWRKGGKKREVRPDMLWEGEELFGSEKFGLDEVLKGSDAIGLEAEEIPEYVAAVPRFEMDVDALIALTQSPVPPVQRVRFSKTASVYYGFGDASKAGFGATIQIGDQIKYQYGQWSTEVSENESSNWRELANLVEALEREVRENELKGCEIFMFTDNTTAENAFWKGLSHSPRLFELVLRLKKLEMKADLLLHVIHVSGKRMIAQGTDGLSRGDHAEGVMQGLPMSCFIPLHKTALEREPKLKDWLKNAMGRIDTTFLDPAGWFTTAHTFGNFIWTPAPAAADVVVEQLGKARHKRPECLHLVVAPRLMTGRWRRHMGRQADFYFKIQNSDIWGKAQFEPLLIFVCLPIRPDRPEFKKREKLLEEFRREMLGPKVWEASSKRGRGILRKLLERARGLCSMQR
jgi:hypothetical protein